MSINNFYIKQKYMNFIECVLSIVWVKQKDPYKKSILKALNICPEWYTNDV